jgi:hypothetical protein
LAQKSGDTVHNQNHSAAKGYAVVLFYRPFLHKVLIRKKQQRFLQNERAASNLLNIRIFSLIETAQFGLLSATRRF